MKVTKTLLVADRYAHRSRLTAEARIDKYFAITGDLSQKGHIYACGCLHDEVAKYVPEFAPFVKWHLVDAEGTPMHYIANGMYHVREGKIDYFKSTVVWGEVPNDSVVETEYGCIENIPAGVLKDYLIERLPYLQEAFKQDMRKFFGVI